MPSCRPDVIPAVVYAALEMKPKSVLDVGVGHGKWGVLLSEYLRYWIGIEPTIDGIESHAGYESAAYGAYRTIFRSDVMERLDIVGDYDLVIVIDVIEHLKREDGLRLLEAIRGHYIVTTPTYWSAQGALFGNERERHISRWTRSDFANSKLVRDVLGRDHIFGWR